MITPNQKIAFTSIIIEMANADGTIDARECVAVKRILSSLNVDAETFKLAKHIPLNVAVEVMADASVESKIFLAEKLVEVIDADEVVADSEVKLLNAVARRLELEQFFLKKG